MTEKERVQKLLKDHVFTSPEYLEIVVLLHAFFDDFEKMHHWLIFENLNFGGSTPAQLIIRGRGHKVLSFINNALRENGEL